MQEAVAEAVADESVSFKLRRSSGIIYRAVLRQLIIDVFVPCRFHAFACNYQCLGISEIPDNSVVCLLVCRSACPLVITHVHGIAQGCHQRGDGFSGFCRTALAVVVHHTVPVEVERRIVRPLVCAYACFGPFVVIHYLCQGGGYASCGTLFAIHHGALHVVWVVLVPFCLDQRENLLVFIRGGGTVCRCGTAFKFRLVLLHIGYLPVVFGEPPAQVLRHVALGERPAVGISQHGILHHIVAGNDHVAVAPAHIEHVMSVGLRGKHRNLPDTRLLHHTGGNAVSHKLPRDAEGLVGRYPVGKEHCRHT